jgi:alpha/beta superfamily hydrolase
VQGDKDSVVSEEQVSELSQRLIKQKNINISYNVIEGADHFFRDKIDLLNEEVDSYLKTTFSHEIGKTAKKSKNNTAETSTTSRTKKVFL